MTISLVKDQLLCVSLLLKFPIQAQVEIPRCKLQHLIYWAVKANLTLFPQNLQTVLKIIQNFKYFKIGWMKKLTQIKCMRLDLYHQAGANKGCPMNSEIPQMPTNCQECQRWTWSVCLSPRHLIRQTCTRLNSILETKSRQSRGTIKSQMKLFQARQDCYCKTLIALNKVRKNRTIYSFETMIIPCLRQFQTVSNHFH